MEGGERRMGRREIRYGATRPGDFALTAAAPAGMRSARPRIGLYQSFIANMDEGWTRWLLEEFGFAYTDAAQCRYPGRQSRRARFDTIVFADEQAEPIANGHRRVPCRRSSPAGIGAKGADALRQFAAAGGTLIFLNKASEYAIRTSRRESEERARRRRRPKISIAPVRCSMLISTKRTH